MSDLVFSFSFETWADAVAREFSFSVDRLLIGAMGDRRVDRLMVVNPWRSLVGATIRRLQGRPSPALPERERPMYLYEPMRFRRRDSVRTTVVERSYRVLERRIERRARDLGLRRPAVITANPFLAAYGGFEWASQVTYYAMDDWRGSHTHEAHWHVIDAAYEQIRRRRRQVAAVSQPIVDRISPEGRSMVIPNAVDPAEWEPPWQLPPWAVGIEHPLILYIGNLGRRLDIDAVRATAAYVSEGTVLLVGPVVDPGSLDALRDVPNVRIEDRVQRRHVVGLIREADVCIMPHRRSRLTEAMSPLKVYEYLAGGARVVATDLPPVRGLCTHVVLVADGDADGFGRAVRTSLAAKAMPEAARRAFIEANSWSTRTDDLLELALSDATGV